MPLPHFPTPIFQSAFCAEGTELVECPEYRVVREANPGEPGRREAEEHMVKSSGSNHRTQTAEPLSLQTRIFLSAQSSGLIASMQQVTKVTSLAHAAASEDPTEGPRVSCGENPGQTLLGLLLAWRMASSFLLQCAPSLCSSLCSKLH